MSHRQLSKLKPKRSKNSKTQWACLEKKVKCTKWEMLSKTTAEIFEIFCVQAASTHFTLPRWTKCWMLPKRFPLKKTDQVCLWGFVHIHIFHSYSITNLLTLPILKDWPSIYNLPKSKVDIQRWLALTARELIC